MNKKEATIIIKTRKDSSHGHLELKSTLPASWLGAIIKELGRLGVAYEKMKKEGKIKG